MNHFSIALGAVILFINFSSFPMLVTTIVPSTNTQSVTATTSIILSPAPVPMGSAVLTTALPGTDRCEALEVSDVSSRLVAPIKGMIIRHYLALFKTHQEQGKAAADLTCVPDILWHNKVWSELVLEAFSQVFQSTQTELPPCLKLTLCGGLSRSFSMFRLMKNYLNEAQESVTEKDKEIPDTSSALVASAKYGSVSALRFLAHHSAFVKAHSQTELPFLVDVNGKTLLTHAIEKGNEPVVRFFLSGEESQDSDENNTDDEETETALLDEDFLTRGLHTAIQHGHSAVVQLFLEQGADPNAECDGSNALQAAAMPDELIDFYLTNRGFSPTDAAWQQAHQEFRQRTIAVVKVILADERIDVNLLDARGDCVVHKALQHPELTQIAQIIIAAGADLSIQDRFHVTGHDLLKRSLN